MSFRILSFSLLILHFLFFSLLSAEAPDTLWTRTYGGSGEDYGRSVQQTGDGGFVIAGYTNSFGAGGYDVYLIRTDPNGDTLWTKTYGGTEDDYGYSLDLTSDGGIIISGSTYSFGSINEDVYLIRTDSNGDTLWTKTYGYGIGYSVQQTEDEGFIIVRSQQYVHLIRTNSNGEILWTKYYGGTDGNHGYSLIQTGDGLIVAGDYWFTESIIFPYLIRTDLNGDTLWTKTYRAHARFTSVCQTNDKGFIALGGAMTNIYLVRTDSDGDTLWSKTFGGTEINDNNSLQITNDGGFIIAGCDSRNSEGGVDVYLIRTDQNGDTLWTKTYGGDSADIGRSIQKTSDGGYIITGETASFGAGRNDVYIIRLDKETPIKHKNLPNNSPNLLTLHNFPNPFSKTTTITCTLQQPAVVTIEIYNLFGKRIRTLINQYAFSGNHSIQWNGTNDRNMQVSKGVYYSVVTIGTGAEKIQKRGRMVLE